LPSIIPVKKIGMEPSSAVDDVALLTRIAQRDQTALSLFYDRYARIIYGLAFKSLRSVEESEEVVLDVFAQVWRIADRYDVQKGKADTWLFTLARSRICDRLRKLQRSHSTAIVSIEAIEIQPKADCVDLFEEASIKERRSQVMVALQTLPKEQRLVLELAYYQGLSQGEIAAQTGLALGTVKTRIRLGLSKLKSALGSNEYL
jgi:RNA polymerase sigma-70 factor (ECF subfamily)